MTYCKPEDTHIMGSLWEFLNSNLISALLGAIIFGVIAGLILNSLLGRRERKALTRQVELILNEAIKNNLEMHDVLIEQLKKGKVTMVPNPFNVTPLQVILQGKFVEVMEPDLVNEVASAYRYCDMINNNYARLAELMTGTAAALEGAEKLRSALIEECQRQMPGLKEAHQKAKKLIRKVPID